jgi:hypothetical protein
MQVCSNSLWHQFSNSIEMIQNLLHCRASGSESLLPGQLDGFQLRQRQVDRLVCRANDNNKSLYWSFVSIVHCLIPTSFFTIMARHHNRKHSHQPSQLLVKRSNQQSKASFRHCTSYIFIRIQEFDAVLATRIVSAQETNTSAPR